jgi:hypothetical protein
LPTQDRTPPRRLFRIAADHAPALTPLNEQDMVEFAYIARESLEEGARRFGAA